MICTLPYRGLSGGNQEWSWGPLVREGYGSITFKQRNTYLDT
jgi:hypothetical protein